MGHKIVRYVGAEHFDAILCTSRILSRLGKKVLIIDHTNDTAIKSVIPTIDTFDCNDQIMNYRDINYICSLPREDISRFDVILMIYGFHPNGFTRCENDLCFIVSTQMEHENIKIHDYIKNKDTSNSFLIIRDVHDLNRIDSTIRILGLQNTSDQSKVSTILYDHSDVYHAFYCENRKSVSFYGISYSFKQHLIHHVQSILPDVPVKDIKRAYESAKKGFRKI